MSTFSSSLELTLIGTGQQAGAWGNTTNTNLQIIEQAIAGVVTITMSSANYTLTNTQGAVSPSNNMVLVVKGTNSGVFQVVTPLVTKYYVVSNQTTGGYAITIGASTGTTVTIPNGTTTSVYCDGTNFYAGSTGVAGNFSVGGNETVAGTLGVTGNTSLSGTLAVAGATTLSGTTSLAGTATALTVTPSTDSSTKIATTAFVQGALASAAITGTINMWPTSSAPSGYLLCNGSAISRTTYAALFAIVGTTFGSGDGLTTFNLPNYADRMPIGVGSTAASVGATGGSATTTIVANNLPAHTHPVTDPGHNHTYAHAYNAAPQSGSSTPCFTSTYTDNTSTATTGITVGNNSTTNSAMNTISPYLGIYFIIKT